MTLDELRRRTLELINATRKQLRRHSWQDGMSDEEFIDKVLNHLEHQITDDICVEILKRERGGA
jgi:hypothetical protein